jgi:AhpD family alkylhydroperoxidase
MNLLAHVEAAEPVGAAALLELADPAELARFRSLEDLVWAATTLPATVIEAVRIRCARVRGCAFCASVRMSGAVEAGLSEAQLADQDEAATRAGLPADQRAALRLVDAYLLEAATPPPDEAQELLEVLGTEGVVEVLVACGVFASADLRIALGDNRAATSPTVHRAHLRRARTSATGGWPGLTASALLPSQSLPWLDPTLDATLRGLREDLFAQRDVPPALLAACMIRSAQLLGAADGSTGTALLAPPDLRAGVREDEVRTWTGHLRGLEHAGMAFAEQLWLDPGGLDEQVVGPLRSALGDAALIRHTWRLIWIGQFQRLSAVLGPTEEGRP